MKLQKAFSLFRILAAVIGIVSLSGAILYTTSPVVVSFATSLDLELPWKQAELKKLDRVLYYIDQSYFDPERIDYQNMLRKALNTLSLKIPEMNVRYKTSRNAVIEVAGQKKEIDIRVPQSSALALKIRDVLPFIFKNQEEKKATIADLEEWAIHGILDTLDPHSNFLSKDVYDETRVGTSGKFGGLGIVIGIRDSKLTVISPLDGTPATAAGIQASDIITKIEKESTVGMTLTEAVDRMRGDRGTDVTITISRKNWKEPRNFKLTRAEIKLVAVESALLPQDIGYLKIKSFQGNLSKDVQNHLDKLHASSKQKLRGLILDLRNNPGGLLDEAIKVSDLFLEEGTIVSTVGMQNRVRNVERARKAKTEPPYPMIVLVNEGSASASEIVAGALQRNGRALIDGKRTFGKGTVQSIYELPQDSAVKLTIAKYKTPGDISIQSLGIVEDTSIVPAIINKNEIIFGEREDNYGEASLERHFSNLDNPSISLEPLDRIEYLFEEKEVDENEDNVRGEYQFSSLSNDQKRAKLFEDFNTRFAFEVLSHASSPQRGKMIALSKNIAKRWRAIEDTKIEKAFAALGIDWSKKPEESSAIKGCKAPKFSYSLSPKKEVFETGDTIHIQAVLKNQGPCDLYQTKAQLSSENSIFDGQTFYFGKIASGQSLSKEIDVKIPNYVVTNLSKVDFDFEESAGFVPRSQSFWIPIQRKNQPKFVFHYDYKKKGKDLELNIHVKNIGKAPLIDSFVTVSQSDSYKSLKLKSSRKTLQKLNPGEEEKVSFDLKLPEMEQPSYGLSVSIADLDYREFIVKDFEISPSRDLSSTFFESPTISLKDFNTLGKAKPESSFKLEAKVSDDHKVKDVYILVNEEKVFYQKIDSAINTKPSLISANLPLQAGSNDIVIVARDNENLSQSYGLQIHRDIE